MKRLRMINSNVDNSLNYFIDFQNVMKTIVMVDDNLMITHK